MNGGNCGNTNDVITTVVILWNVWVPSLINGDRSGGRGGLACRDFVPTSTALHFFGGRGAVKSPALFFERGDILVSQS